VKSESQPRYTFAQRLVLAVVPRLVWALMQVYGRTWRYEVIAEEGAAPYLYGQKVGPVIAGQVEEAMLGRRTRLDTAAAEQESAGRWFFHTHRSMIITRFQTPRPDTARKVGPNRSTPAWSAQLALGLLHVCP